MHNTTYEYLKPSEGQLEIMGKLRSSAKHYSDQLEHYLPDSVDKTYLLRKLREVAMWANVAVTREADGSPKP